MAIVEVRRGIRLREHGSGILDTMGTGKRRVLARIGWTITTALILILAVAAYAHRQQITDRVAAAGFDAPMEISELTERLNLTEDGEVVFFATQPTLESSQYFNDQCSRVDHVDGGHVLGCFSDGNIHLFEVRDERLNGIVEVTAAHELLHAVHARMRDSEREEFDRRLEAEYEVLAQTNPALVERMKVYEGLSRSGFANELHSVLGTEVAVLPEWLEAHYARWFLDRSMIVTLFDGYHGLFVALQEEADNLAAELETIRASVEQRNAAYSEAVDAFNADAREFKRRNENFEFSSNVTEFNRLMTELGERRAALDTELAAIRAEVARFDEKRARLEEIGKTSADLDQQIDSGLAPPGGRAEG